MIERLQTIEDVKPLLTTFLNKNYPSIRALRAKVQFDNAGTKLSQEDKDKLRKAIKTGFAEQPYPKASLCVIDERTATFQGHARWGKLKKDTGTENAISGFWFATQLSGIHFECVILDDGQSRQYFDLINQEEKREFVKKFAYRDKVGYLLKIGAQMAPDNINQYINSEQPIEYYTAFVTQSPDQSLSVETLVARRSLEVNETELFVPESIREIYAN